MKKNLFKMLCKKRKKTLVLAFNTTFRYIDVVLFINSSLLHSYVNSIYPSVLKLKKDMTCDDNEKYSKVQNKSRANKDL